MGFARVKIMWRYFEQQSFYMQEDEFASHCEAVALLLKEWNAVDYFCDYVASIKKRRKCFVICSCSDSAVECATVCLIV